MNKPGKKNILLLAGTLQSGGTEKHFYQLCTQLSREKFVLHLGLEKPVRNDFGHLPEDVHAMLLEGSYLQKARQIRNYIRKNNIQLIYSCAFETSFPVLLTWPVIFYRLTFITGVRGKFFFPLSRKIIAWLISFISKNIVCNSQKAIEYVPEIFRKKCLVIYNGISTSTLPLSQAQARKELGLSHHTKIIGCVARLCNDKGQDILLEAFVNGFPTESSIELVLIGDGEDRHMLDNRIRELGIQGKVHLKGNISNASRYLSALDLFVLPSRNESFPNALLEAMQHKLPCVATRVGGVEEIYKIINFGYVVSPEDIKELSEALQKGINMPTQTYDLSRFSLTQNIQAYEQVFSTASV